MPAGLAPACPFLEGTAPPSAREPGSLIGTVVFTVACVRRAHHPPLTACTPYRSRPPTCIPHPLPTGIVSPLGSSPHWDPFTPTAGSRRAPRPFVVAQQRAAAASRAALYWLLRVRRLSSPCTEGARGGCLLLGHLHLIHT
jgi:hypothetical protein